jgi:hypothetical protein
MFVILYQIIIHFILTTVQDWYVTIEKEIELREQLQYLFSVKDQGRELLLTSTVKRGLIEANKCDKMPCVITNSMKHKRKRRGDKHNSRRIHRQTSHQDRELKRVKHQEYYKKKELFDLDDGTTMFGTRAEFDSWLVNVKKEFYDMKDDSWMYCTAAEWRQWVMAEIIKIETDVDSFKFKNMGSTGGIMVEFTEYETMIILEANSIFAVEEIFAAMAQSRLKGSGANNAGDGPSAYEVITAAQQLLSGRVILHRDTKLIKTTPNGNCLFECFVKFLNNDLTPIQMRQKICSHISMYGEESIGLDDVCDSASSSVTTFEKYIFLVEGIDLLTYVNSMKFATISINLNAGNSLLAPHFVRKQVISTKYGGDIGLHAFSKMENVFVEVYVKGADDLMVLERCIDLTTGTNPKKTIRLFFTQMDATKNENHYELIDVTEEENQLLTQTGIDFRSQSMTESLHNCVSNLQLLAETSSASRPIDEKTQSTDEDDDEPVIKKIKKSHKPESSSVRNARLSSMPGIFMFDVDTHINSYIMLFKTNVIYCETNDNLN